MYKSKIKPIILIHTSDLPEKWQHVKVGDKLLIKKGAFRGNAVRVVKKTEDNNKGDFFAHCNILGA